MRQSILSFLPTSGVAAGLLAAALVTFAASEASAQCPDGYPYDCGDGYCSTTPEGCSGSSCPDGYPYDCGNGQCSWECPIRC